MGKGVKRDKNAVFSLSWNEFSNISSRISSFWTSASSNSKTKCFIFLQYKIPAGAHRSPGMTTLFSAAFSLIFSSIASIRYENSTAQPSPASSSTYHCHCPEIGTQLPCCLFSVRPKISRLGEQRGCRRRNKTGNGRSVEDNKKKKGHRWNTNQSKQWEEWSRNNFLRPSYPGFDVLKRMEALCFTFLQRLYFHTRTFGRPAITMSASSVFCLLFVQMRAQYSAEFLGRTPYLLPNIFPLTTPHCTGRKFEQ